MNDEPIPQKGQIISIMDFSMVDILPTLYQYTLDARKNGSTVFFISFEQDVNHLYNQLKERADDNLDNNPVYIRHGFWGMSAESVRKDIEHLETLVKITPDLIVIDNLEKLMPSYEQKKKELAKLLNIAKEKHIAVITAELIKQD